VKGEKGARAGAFEEAKEPATPVYPSTLYRAYSHRRTHNIRTHTEK
jgi:hypothetical protein